MTNISTKHLGPFPYWTSLNGRKYWVAKVEASQPEATAYCNAMGGILAEPKSAEENEMITKLAAEDEDSYWIGVDDIENEAYDNKTGYVYCVFFRP